MPMLSMTITFGVSSRTPGATEPTDGAGAGTGGHACRRRRCPAASAAAPTDGASASATSATLEDARSSRGRVGCCARHDQHFPRQRRADALLASAEGEGEPASDGARFAGRSGLAGRAGETSTKKRIGGPCWCARGEKGYSSKFATTASSSTSGPAPPPPACRPVSSAAARPSDQSSRFSSRPLLQTWEYPIATAHWPATARPAGRRTPVVPRSWTAPAPPGSFAPACCRRRQRA